jgi:hypothetical protein
MAVASLVLGIISLFFCIWYIAIPSAILAIIFGSIAGKRAKEGTGGGAGMAKAGFIMGCIGLAIDVVAVILIFTIGLAFFKGIQKQMQQQQPGGTSTPAPVTPTPAPAPSTPGSSTQSFHLGLGERVEFRGVTISF